MGRTAGVTPDQTRAKLLAAAANAFERQGFEGTRVADIADEAGVSKGAMYGHFRSKAELLSASLRDRGQADLDALFAADDHPPVLDLLVMFGERLLHRRAPSGALVVEALVAARRDGEVAATMAGHLNERHRWLADVIADGQRAGDIDPAFCADAVARFCIMLVLGSLLLPATGLPQVDQAAWSGLVAAIGAAVRPAAGRTREEAP